MMVLEQGTGSTELRRAAAHAKHSWSCAEDSRNRSHVQVKDKVQLHAVSTWQRFPWRFEAERKQPSLAWGGWRSCDSAADRQRLDNLAQGEIFLLTFKYLELDLKSAFRAYIKLCWWNKLWFLPLRAGPVLWACWFTPVTALSSAPNSSQLDQTVCRFSKRKGVYSKLFFYPSLIFAAAHPVVVSLMLFSSRAHTLSVSVPNEVPQSRQCYF